MSQNHLKEEELAKLANLFLSADKDKDGKISIKQLCKIMGQDFNAIAQNQAQEPSFKYSLFALIGKIKIDFLTFLEFHEKHELSKILKQAETETSNGEEDNELELRLVQKYFCLIF